MILIVILTLRVNIPCMATTDIEDSLSTEQYELVETNSVPIESLTVKSVTINSTGDTEVTWLATAREPIEDVVYIFGLYKGEQLVEVQRSVNNTFAITFTGAELVDVRNTDNNTSIVLLDDMSEYRAVCSAKYEIHQNTTTNGSGNCSDTPIYICIGLTIGVFIVYLQGHFREH